MTLHLGFGTNSVDIDAPDVRLALAGLFLRDMAGRVRQGVLPHTTAPLVAARADMKVDIPFFNAVVSRDGTYGALPFGNDGTIQSPAFEQAPTANSRIDHLYVIHPDTVKGEAGGLPSFGIVKGDAAPTPVAKGLPAGAMSWATVQIPSTATTTASANVVITPTYPYAAPSGTAFLVRSLTELTPALAATFGEGVRARSLDTGTEWVVRASTANSVTTNRWVRLGGGTFRATRNSQPVGNASLSTIGSMSRDSSWSDRDDFATINTDGVTIIEGDYVVVATYAIGAPAIARSFLSLACGSVGMRSGIPIAEDGGTVPMNIHVPAGGLKVVMQVFQQSGDIRTGSQSIQITKVA